MTVTEEELQRIVAAAVKVALKEVKGIEGQPEKPAAEVEVSKMGDEELDEGLTII